MLKNIINYFTGSVSNLDEASIRELNRMELELEKVKLERELFVGANSLLHRI